MITKQLKISLTSGKNMVYLALFCLLVAFCGNASAETINRKAVKVWKRGFLEMHEAAELVKEGDDREAMYQYILASKYFEEVRKNYPDFEPDMVIYRLNECYAAIEEIRARHPNDIFFAMRPSELAKEKTELVAQNRELMAQNQKLKKDYNTLYNELKNSTESAMVNRMITAARQFDQLLKDDHASPTTVADANARYKLYTDQVRKLRDLLYPDNYVVGGIVNGVWMLDSHTGDPVYFKSADIEKRGLPAVLTR